MPTRWSHGSTVRQRRLLDRPLLRIQNEGAAAAALSIGRRGLLVTLGSGWLLRGRHGCRPSAPGGRRAGGRGAGRHRPAQRRPSRSSRERSLGRTKRKRTSAQRPSGSTLPRISVSPSPRDTNGPPQPRVPHGKARHKQTLHPLQLETGLTCALIELDPRHIPHRKIASQHGALHGKGASRRSPGATP
jgi:hypothetical protein